MRNSPAAGARGGITLASNKRTACAASPDLPAQSATATAQQPSPGTEEGGYASTPAMPMELSAVSITGDSASATPWCAIQRSASSAAMQPDPAALIAWR